MTSERSIAIPPTSRVRWRPRAGNLRDYGIVASFAALFIALSVGSDPFLTDSNLRNILDQWAPTGLVAVAATLVLITGNFDVSVGGSFGLAGVVAASLAGDASMAVAL